MSSRAWRCRCARLESRWIRFHKFVSPSGYYDEEYVYEAKKFFLPMIPGMRDASRKHDAMARRKYVKPFKWFKFNRARRATAK